MAKALFFVLAALLIVAAMADFGYEEEDFEGDIEFLKRDPEMQDFWLAEKRGKSMRKYKYCGSASQDCWCSRRSNKVVFCSGAGNGNGI